MSRLLIMFLFAGFTVYAANTKDTESFQQVWETIRDKHWDLEGTGVNWDQVYQTYQPKVEAAESRTEVRKLINAMLGELGQSHFRILEGSSQKGLESLMASIPWGTGVTGFKVNIIKDRMYIVDIDKDVDAHKKGLGIGTQILKIGDKESKEIVSTLNKAFAGAAHPEMYINQYANQFFGGPVGGALVLVVSQDGQENKVEVELGKPKGRFMPLLNLDRVYYNYESKILPGNIAYIAFNIFVLDAKMAFEKDILGPLKDTNGLILDLRGNPGGIGMLSSSIAGRLINEKGLKLGAMTNPGGTLNFPVFPQNPTYEKPVAVLIDGGSASTSEILAQGLKDLKRARLFGSRTAGAALPSMIEKLPNGDSFQFAIADYISTSGYAIEGKGVQPDEPTPHSFHSMSEKQDAALDAAQIWIKSGKANKGATNEDL